MNLRNHQKRTHLTDKEIFEQGIAAWILVALFMCFAWKMMPKQDDPPEYKWFVLYPEVEMTLRWYAKLLGEYSAKMIFAHVAKEMSNTEFLKRFSNIWFYFQTTEFVAFVFWYNIDFIEFHDFGISVTTVKFMTLSIYVLYKAWK